MTPVPLPGTDKDRARIEAVAEKTPWGFHAGRRIAIVREVLAAADAYDRSQGIRRVKMPDRERIAHEIRYQVVGHENGVPAVGVPTAHWLPIADAVLALLTEGTDQ